MLEKYNSRDRDRANIIGNTPYKELGGKDELSHINISNKKFAEKVAAKLDSEGIKYSGKIGENGTTFAVNKNDETAFKNVEASLKQENKKRNAKH